MDVTSGSRKTGWTAEKVRTAEHHCPVPAEVDGLDRHPDAVHQVAQDVWRGIVLEPHWHEPER